MAFNVSFIIRLQDKFSKQSQKVARSAERMKLRVLAAGGATGKFSDRLAKNRRQLTATRTGLIGVAAAAASVILPVREAIRFETEMANVKKVLREVTPENLATIRDIALDLSKTLPIAPEELLRTAAALKKMEVPLSDLKEFTRLISETTIAIEGIVPEETALVFARFENLFGGGAAAVRDMTDATNELSNRMAITGTVLIEAMANRTAFAGKAMGLTANQSIALAATFGSLGIQGSQVGTTIRKMTLAFKNADKVGDDLFEAFQLDPQGTLLAFLDQLGELPEKARVATAVDLFGARFALNVKGLSENMDKYRRALDIATNRSVFAGSVQRELANVLATTQANLDLTKNSFKRLGIEIGETQLPLINLLADSITNINDTFADLAKRFPKITGFITSMTIAIIALTAAAFVAKFALAGLAIVGVGITAVFGATAAAFVAGLASVVAITVGVGALGVALGSLFTEKAFDVFLNKFSKLGKEIRSLNEELKIDIKPKITKALRGLDIPKGIKGLESETKQLFLLNASIAETKLQIQQGAVKGADVGLLESNLTSLATAKQRVLVEINLKDPSKAVESVKTKADEPSAVIIDNGMNMDTSRQ